MAKQETKDGEKLGRRIGGVIIVGFLGLVAYLVFWAFYEGSPKEIVSVADQFKPQPEWQLKQDSVVPPRNGCIDIECPSVGRSWTLPQEINREQFEQIAQMGTTKLTISSDCFEKDETGYVIKSCDATGVIDGYDVSLSYSGSKPQIVLSVGKAPGF